MTNAAVARGGCLCGAVRFEVDLPAKWCSHCHCTLCRRAHGAAFVTWFGVYDSAYRLLSGEDVLRWYDSSAQAERGFCSVCGSTMFFRSSRWPGEVHITLAHMEDEVYPQPTVHVYWDRHVQWVELGDTLERLGGESGVEPL